MTAVASAPRPEHSDPDAVSDVESNAAPGAASRTGSRTGSDTATGPGTNTETSTGATVSGAAVFGAAVSGAAVFGAAARDVVSIVSAGISGYRFDQYLNYPAQDRNRWAAYLLSRLQKSLGDPEQTFYVADSPDGPVVLAARVAAWDRDHFGFGMGGIRCVIAPETETARPTIDALFSQCLNDLRSRDVRFASARIHGDQIAVTHSAETAGFRYFESILWPVRASRAEVSLEPDVRLMEERDLDGLMKLAVGNSYTRGHFYCDSGFDHIVVDSMYAKWLETAFRNGQPVTVIDFEGRCVGFFVVGIDESLSAALGVRYGRLQSLVVDGRIRGRGLGVKLFHGTLELLTAAGVEQIDSGYSAKNHLSARIHAKDGFFTVYDENTFHIWLDDSMQYNIRNRLQG
jgi:L-amino acid N-acyltransferase YncA